jgi:hypothetical protein
MPTLFTDALETLAEGSESGVTNGQSVSSDGNEGGYTLNDETPVTDRGYHQNSSSDNGCQKWRRRESNESARCRNHITYQQVTNSSNALAGNRQETEGTTWLDLSSVDPLLCRVIDVWDDLPEYVQSAVIDLCRV